MRDERVEMSICMSKWLIKPAIGRCWIEECVAWQGWSKLDKMLWKISRGMHKTSMKGVLYISQ